MIMLLLAILIAYWADAEYGGDSAEGTLCAWAMCLVLIATATPDAWQLSYRLGTGAICALILVLAFDKVNLLKKGETNV
jgi:hypothetical protein